MRDADPSLPRPRRRFGQNFLVDRALAERIVAKLAPAPGEHVLEIGPGQGALTALLLAGPGSLAAVEIDRDLARALRERFGERLRLVEGDFLEQPLDRVRMLAGFPASGPLVIVSNLPFNISKPVASRLVRERAQIARAVLTFQREVADRLTSAPGTAAYGPLGILAQEAFRIERLFDLPPAAFRPRPKVLSSVTSWTPLPPERFPAGAESALRATLAACFAHRRRTLWNNLRAALPDGEAGARAILDRTSLDGSLRAEDVPPEGFRRLALAWPLSGTE